MDLSPEAYQRSWAQMMTRIWSDRIRLHQAIDTGTLLRSISQGTTTYGPRASLSFHFLDYGLYVDRGTGRGYTRGNGGDLKFKGKAYRQAHNLGAERQRRPWFSVSWNISCRRFADQMAAYYKTGFVGIFDRLR